MATPMDEAARAQPKRWDHMIILPTVGSKLSTLRQSPRLVSSLVSASIAPSSTSSSIALVTDFGCGGVRAFARNAGIPSSSSGPPGASPNFLHWRHISSSGVRSSSLSRNGRRDAWRRRENRWKHTPAFVLPARPLRCLADAWLIHTGCRVDVLR